MANKEKDLFETIADLIGKILKEIFGGKQAMTGWLGLVLIVAEAIIKIVMWKDDVR